MTPHFLPKRLGKSPVLEAEVFKQLTRSKRETTREAIERRRSGE